MSETQTDAPDISGALFSLVEGLSEIPESFTVPIAPIAHAGTTYTEIVLREPKSDHVRRAQEQLRTGPSLPHNVTNYEMHLIANVSGAPFEVVRQMGVARRRVAMTYLDLFLGYGPGIGPS